MRREKNREREKGEKERKGCGQRELEKRGKWRKKREK